MSFIFETTSLLLSVVFVLFLPGLLLLVRFFRKESLSSWEITLFSFALSIGILDFIMILIGKIGIPLSPLSIIGGFLFLGGIFFLGEKILKKYSTKKQSYNEKESPLSPKFSRKESLLFMFLLFVTICIKILYLSDAAFPTATDLGHHMYWAKQIAETKTLPQYQKQELEEKSDGTIALSEPSPIADFIIGEHLPFAALAQFSGNNFVSAFPVSLLFLVHILSLIALSFLALRLGEEFQNHSIIKSITPERIALVTLFLIGPLYALASPQAKFVAGGVVGNTFGNLFIPLILLALYRAIKERRPLLLALGFFLIFTLAYTHHLSTLVLLFILMAILGTYSIVHGKNFKQFFLETRGLILTKPPILTALFCTLFFFAVAMPTYLNTHGAIDTAIGTPTKSTRTGLAFSQLVFSNGEARVALGLTGILILLTLIQKARFAAGLIVAWSGILLIMSLHPEWVFLDIPSNRIGSYTLFPLTVAASFSILFLIDLFRQNYGSKQVSTIPSLAPLAFLLVFFSFSVGSGLFDNGQTLLGKPKAEDAVQTFAASEYLAQRIKEDDLILKDHNYLTGDTWMKLFFLKDYGFPLSRSYFQRYDTPGREKCTLKIISVPNTEEGRRCIDETGINLIVVHPDFDRAQFEKSDVFSRIYSSESIHIYEKN